VRPGVGAQSAGPLQECRCCPLVGVDELTTGCQKPVGRLVAQPSGGQVDGAKVGPVPKRLLQMVADKGVLGWPLGVPV